MNNDLISISTLSSELHDHADKLSLAVSQASDRSEHVRMTQLALEAARLALALDRFISQNTEVGTGPVSTIPLKASV